MANEFQHKQINLINDQSGTVVWTYYCPFSVPYRTGVVDAVLDALSNNVDFTNVRIENAEFNGTILPNMNNLSRARFKNCSFEQTNWDIKFNQAKFDNCIFNLDRSQPTMTFEICDINNCTFNGSIDGNLFIDMCCLKNSKFDLNYVDHFNISSSVATNCWFEFDNLQSFETSNQTAFRHSTIKLGNVTESVKLIDAVVVDSDIEIESGKMINSKTVFRCSKIDNKQQTEFKQCILHQSVCNLPIDRLKASKVMIIEGCHLNGQKVDKYHGTFISNNKQTNYQVYHIVSIDGTIVHLH